MHDVGPNFDKGMTRIGRKRLPAGFVAILDDPQTLRLAIRELHAYAVAGSQFGKRGIVFRIVSAEERQAILYKLQDLLGVENFAENSARYYIPEGHWHLLDSEHLLHVHQRHSEIEFGQTQEKFPVTIKHIERVSEVLHPRNIFTFVSVRGLPRIGYRRTYDDGSLVVIQEIRSAEVAVKTIYREK